MAALRILADADVQAAITGPVALDLARQALRGQAEGSVLLSSPAAMALDASALGGPRFKFKAAALGHLNASGIRLVGRGAGGARASNYCAIFDHADARLAGLVPDFWLSRIRTAAFGVAVAERLVKSGPLVVALFGAGAIAREIVPLLTLALPVKELRVHSRRAESMQAFAADMAASTSLAVRAEPARAKMAPGADLVITLTESKEPLVRPGELDAGAVVCSMGGNHELDYGVLLESQRLVVDDTDYAAEAGDGGAWIRLGHLSLPQFRARVDALACEVVAGTKPGRLQADDRIVALMQGMAIGDIAFAAHALREAERSHRGTLVELP
jgi:ornithine cyclodeaminase/alanine dehydrogenase-like protein (mu-crystallin family)